MLRTAGRQRRLCWRRERPMRFILGPVLNPPFESLDLCRRHGLLMVGRGHAHLAVARRDATQQFALLRLPRHDGGHARLASLEGRLALIEPQSTLALLGIGPMTLQ